MTDEPKAPARMTLSRVLELVLSRPATDRSSVTLSRNAKGETQIEVVVSATDELPLPDAEVQACDIYDRLSARYANESSIGEGASVTLSRNAKGETQIEVMGRGDATPDAISGLVRVEFDRLRQAFPMSTGMVGAVAAPAGGTDGGQA